MILSGDGLLFAVLFLERAGHSSSGTHRPLPTSFAVRHSKTTVQPSNLTIPCKRLAILDNSTLPFHMFSSTIFVLPAWYPACLGPSGFGPSCYITSCLSLIPAARSVFKTVSRSQPSKQILSSYWWLSAVSCPVPNPTALARQTPHEPLRSACLSLYMHQCCMCNNALLIVTQVLVQSLSGEHHPAGATPRSFCLRPVPGYIAHQ